MRASGVLLVLLLSAVLISHSEGWIFKSATLKTTAKTVVSWVKAHCSVGFPQFFSCSLGRRRRDANAADPKIIESENNLCMDIMHDSVLLEQGFTFALVKDIFDEVDRGNKTDEADDVLDEQEFDEFMEAMEVLHYCFSQNK